MENLKKALLEAGVPNDKMADILDAVKQDRFIPYERFEEVNRQKKDKEAACIKLEEEICQYRQMQKDIEIPEKRIKELEAVLENQQDDFEKRLSEKTAAYNNGIFEMCLAKSLKDAKAKNHAAVRALVNLKEDDSADLCNACEIFDTVDREIVQIQKEYPYLFEEKENIGFRIGAAGETLKAPASILSKAFGN